MFVIVETGWLTRLGSLYPSVYFVYVWNFANKMFKNHELIKIKYIMWHYDNEKCWQI